ncbi:PQQ-binding-like beta-propeller repeat protein [Planctomycetes bacterium TBK1r]|uniref:Outer membrane biogenesis protein BamB n=1 Tax=Stieleria magnilauensis TaxID=2527963 RepID=A0ABX5XXH2_9BACT|nr:outer membrane biogenesis protein BamB [Planctomycetes bacterium TBK1r]
MNRFCVVFACVACFSSLLIPAADVTAGDWSQFRGPQADGVASSADYPTEWSDTENVRWSVALPQPGNGSPIVVDGNVFVCSAEDSKGLARSLICFDADNGHQRWSRTVTLAEEMPTHKTNPYAGSTPACDGSRVVVWHATGGLHAYDMNGAPLWSRDLGEFRHMWGYGSSPVIVGDRVILNSGPGKQVFVAAFDVKSGETLWRHDEPVAGDGERNAEGKYMGTWSTPVPIERDGRQLAIVAMHQRILALDVESGDVVWFFRVTSDRGDLAYSSPMIEGDLCVFNAGFKGPTMAFEMNGRGDITENQRWRIEGNPQSIGTGIMRDGFVYRVGAGPNLIDCLDAKTGETVWQERNKAAFWGSVAMAGQTAYATDQSGTTIVFRLSPDEFTPIAECPLNDSSNATPALAGGRIYLRTNRKLWCVE